MNTGVYHERATSLLDSQLLTNDAEARGTLEAALVIDTEDNHPSNWVPKIQKALIQIYGKHSQDKSSEDFLNLFSEGIKMEERASRPWPTMTFLVALLIGLALGSAIDW